MWKNSSVSLKYKTLVVSWWGTFQGTGSGLIYLSLKTQRWNSSIKGETEVKSSVRYGWGTQRPSELTQLCWVHERVWQQLSPSLLPHFTPSPPSLPRSLFTSTSAVPLFLIPPCAGWGDTRFLLLPPGCWLRSSIALCLSCDLLPPSAYVSPRGVCWPARFPGCCCGCRSSGAVWHYAAALLPLCCRSA